MLRSGSTLPTPPEALLRLLFDQAPGFIAILEGPEHRFKLVNPAYERLSAPRRHRQAGRRGPAGDGRAGLRRNPRQRLRHRRALRRPAHAGAAAAQRERRRRAALPRLRLPAGARHGGPHPRHLRRGQRRHRARRVGAPGPRSKATGATRSAASSRPCSRRSRTSPTSSTRSTASRTRTSRCSTCSACASTRSSARPFSSCPTRPSWRAASHAQIGEVLATRAQVRGETFYESPTGDKGWFEYIFNPVPDADGTVQHRRRLDAQHQRPHRGRGTTRRAQRIGASRRAPRSSAPRG